MRIILSITFVLTSGLLSLTQIQALATLFVKENDKTLEQSVPISTIELTPLNDSDRLIFKARDLTAKDDEPQRRVGGPKFGGSDCPSVDDAVDVPLTSLVTGEKDNSFRALTTEGHPTFWFYVPYPTTSTLTAKFVLINNEKDLVYQGNYQLTKTPGIISITLPSTTSLEIGKDYKWTFKIICDPEDPAADMFVNGKLQRIDDISSNLIPPGATPEERAIIYAQEGLWYETITTIIKELYPTNPEKAKLRMSELFQSKFVSLEGFVEKNIVECCIPQQSDDKNSNQEDGEGSISN